VECPEWWETCRKDTDQGTRVKTSEWGRKNEEKSKA